MDFRNARPLPQPVRNKVLPYNLRIPGKQLFAEGRINGGMITTLDPTDIPPGALQICRNARSRFDRTRRRPGTILLTPAKPNSNPVIGIFYFKRNNGNTFYYRFTPSTVHLRAAGVWTPYTAGAGGSLAGTATDYISGAVVLDKFVFANNGVDVIQELDTAAQTFKALGNAPRYKFVTGFFNRVIGANLAGPIANGVNIGWSGDANTTEWDPLVDETAGSSPLVESPSDLGDFINGVFGFTNVMVVLREQSIWLATKQPIPTNPFNFYTAFPGVGCNAPYSAKITVNGITWADRRTATVWHYTPGGQPTAIGRPVEKTLMDGVADENRLFSVYDPIQNEYTLCIPQTGSNTVVCWTYNFRTQSWAKDEYEGITIGSNADLSAAVTTIDELVGTIDGLTGTIDGLAPAQPTIPVKAFGRSDGEITIETVDDTLTVDPAFAGSSGQYETELLSKTFTIPKDDIYVAEIRIELIPLGAGTANLYYSKDGGVTISALAKSKTFTGAEIGKPILFRLSKLIHTRRFAWRLTALTGQFDVIGYEVHAYKAGESND